MGLLPTYATIGIAAPVILVFLRFLQGMAVSGELTGSGVYLIESAPEKYKGLYGSLLMCSTYIGLLLGAMVSLLITWFFTEQQLLDYAWRIPFLISFPIGLWVVKIRLDCDDSPDFKEATKDKKIQKMPIVSLFKNYLDKIIMLVLVASTLCVVTHLIIGYFPSYFISGLQFSLNQSMGLCCAALVTLTLAVPLIGMLVGYIKAEKILMFGVISLLLFAYPIFNMLLTADFTTVLLGVIFIALLMAPISATIIYTLSKTFPTAIRCSGVSITYNLSMCIFGGTAPLVALYSSNYFGNDNAPAMYIVISAVLAIAGMSVLRKRRIISKALDLPASN